MVVLPVVLGLVFVVVKGVVLDKVVVVDDVVDVSVVSAGGAEVSADFVVSPAEVAGVVSTIVVGFVVTEFLVVLTIDCTASDVTTLEAANVLGLTVVAATVVALAVEGLIEVNARATVVVTAAVVSERDVPTTLVQ